LVLADPRQLAALRCPAQLASPALIILDEGVRPLRELTYAGVESAEQQKLPDESPILS
jgi:hypothetical protein